SLTRDQIIGAYGVLLLAVVENLSIYYLLRHHPKLLLSGYLTTLSDGLLNIAMVWAGGGFNSPFYYILFTVTISAAMRYGYGPALGISFFYGGFDAVEHWLRQAPIDAPFIFRTGFLALTAVLAGYLREQTQRAEAALQERLRQA